MGATDLQHSLESIDHWTDTGIETRLAPVYLEQQWPPNIHEQLTLAFKQQTGHVPGEGPVWRGRGWRLWYQKGLCIDSRVTRWDEVPDGIILGVSYCGYRRWLVQGVEPFWRGIDGLLYDSCQGDNVCAKADNIRRMGVWVTDEEMRQYRFQAALAFVL